MNALNRLPPAKQHEIRLITDTVTAAAEIEMLILFGSHARGDWVEDSYVKDGITFAYQSDYDLLVIVRSGKYQRNTSLWNDLEQQLQKEIATPVSIIVDTIDVVNRKLKQGHYFYGDIKKEGVVLYDAGTVKLADKKTLRPAEQKILAQQRYDYWVSKATDHGQAYQRARQDRRHNNAAFDLHQVAEALLTATLLVHTEYKPKNHNLAKLLNKVIGIDRDFGSIFPRSTQAEKDRFKLLVRAYVDARYEPSYTITDEELDYLADHIKELQTLVARVCRTKLEK